MIVPKKQKSVSRRRNKECRQSINAKIISDMDVTVAKIMFFASQIYTEKGTGTKDGYNKLFDG